MIKEEQKYKVCEYYCSYQNIEHGKNLTLKEAVKLRDKLSENKKPFVHYQVHKDGVK